MQMADNTLCSLTQVTILGRDPRRAPNLCYVLTRVKDKTILSIGAGDFPVPVISLHPDRQDPDKAPSSDKYLTPDRTLSGAPL